MVQLCRMAQKHLNLKLTHMIAQPVGINARMLAKISAIDKRVKIMTRMRAATSPMDDAPCVNRINNWKSLELLGLKVNICKPEEN